MREAGGDGRTAVEAEPPDEPQEHYEGRGREDLDMVAGRACENRHGHGLGEEDGDSLGGAITSRTRE